jgi:SAM-dependent methyltransferase
VTSTQTDHEIAAAAAYEDLHVPALFRQWSPIVLDLAEVGEGDRVLDVACGTGVLAREAEARCGASGSVAGLDASEGMLAIAERLAPTISWQQGTADSLPYHSDSFDAVVSQFGLMFFPDRNAAIREMLRVLKPGRRLALAVWDALENSEAYLEEVALLERRAGRAAADALRAPFVLGDKADLSSLISDAGGLAVEISTHHGTARFPSVRTMVEADLRGWLPVMGVMLAEELIEGILTEAEQVLSLYVTETGSVEFDSPAHLVTALAQN